MVVRLACLLFTIAMLAGCATVKESYAPDGRKAFALNCSGAARGWDKCLSAAGEKCGSLGYDVLDRNSEEAVVASAGGNSSGFAASAYKTAERTMLIACKKP